MASEKKVLKLRIGGMTCVNCEDAVKKKLLAADGVEKASASYNAGTAAVTYDPGKITVEKIYALIADAGYEALGEDARPKSDAGRTVGMLVIIIAIYIVLQEFGILNYLVPSAIAETDMSYWLVFIIGLTTSVHCIAMCGGINISQCLGRDDVNAGVVGGAALAQKNKSRLAVLWPSILYNGGRVASYTAIGFIVGAIGSVIEFSMAGQGVLKLIAGVFMVVMGLSMLNLFPQLRRFVPRMPKVFTNNKSKGPLAVGLLNGLMPCGPLQAMQIYALSTGSPFKGALSMMLFALGTAPLMFGLGTFSSAIGKKSSQKVMAAGAVMVAVLGLCMLSQSWNLFGAGGSALAAAATQQNSNSGSGGAGAKFNIDLGPQVINSTLQPFGYPSIKVEVGRPVRWVINAPPGSINGCNYRFVISEYGIRYEFKPGENVIEFMPTKTGNVPFTCWMGMMNGTITVEDQGSGSGETAPAAPRKGGGCCG